MRARNAARTVRYENAAYRALLVRIASNLRRLRAAKGWTQEEAAFRCDNMSAPLLRRIELAATNITAVTLSRLAEGFAVDPTALVAAVTEPPPTTPRGRPPKRRAASAEGKTSAATKKPRATKGQSTAATARGGKKRG